MTDTFITKRERLDTCVKRGRKTYRFGRHLAVDRRDERYSMPALIQLARGAPPLTKHWPIGPVLDQGATSSCVGHGWRQFLASSPNRHRLQSPSALTIYRRAQLVDEWEGTDYDGTSVRAGAKYLKELGLLPGGYLWARSLLQLELFVRSRGPVVIGVEWTEGMLETDPKGYIEPTGPELGGHCVMVCGYSHTRDAYRLVNSWGEGWGQRGRAWISADALSELLFTRWGEAVSALEVATA